MTIFGLSFGEASILVGAILAIGKIVYSVDQMQKDSKKVREDQEAANSERKKEDQTFRAELKENQERFRLEVNEQFKEVKESQNKQAEDFQDFKQKFTRLETTFEEFRRYSEKGGV